MTSILELSPSMYGVRAGNVSDAIAHFNELGPGAVGAAVIRQPGTDVEHVVNVVNKGGQVLFIDTQRGTIVTLRPELELQYGAAIRNGETARIK